MDYQKEYEKLKAQVDKKDRELLETYKQLSHLSNQKPKSNVDLKTLILQDLSKLLADVNIYLYTNGIKERVDDLSDILVVLNKLRVLKPSQNYLGVTLDSNGYIVDIAPLHDFVLEQDVPSDILRGYYKIQDGLLYLDKERQALLWRNE